MTKDNDINRMPDSIREELTASDPPGQDKLERYEYMKADFMRAMHEAAREDSRAAIDAAFSLAGRLIEWTDEMLTRTGIPGGASQPAMARGTKRTEEAGERAGPRPIHSVEREFDGVSVRATTLKDDGATEIEINAFDTDDRTEVRPLVIRVYDGAGEAITDPVQVEPTEQAPRFPDPAPGIYVFHISWPDGEGRMQIEFRETQ